MRLTGKVISAAMVLMGGLWALQGLGLVGGSFMTGNSDWLYIGLVTAVVGALGFTLFSRGKKS